MLRYKYVSKHAYVLPTFGFLASSQYSNIQSLLWFISKSLFSKNYNLESREISERSKFAPAMPFWFLLSFLYFIDETF